MGPLNRVNLKLRYHLYDILLFQSLIKFYSISFYFRCIQFIWELERLHFKLAKSTIESIYEPPPPLPNDSTTPQGSNSPLGQLINSKIGKEFNNSEIVKIMDQFLGLIDKYAFNIKKIFFNYFFPEIHKFITSWKPHSTLVKHFHKKASN